MEKQSIHDIHPFDRTAEVARRLDAVSTILWGLAAAHAGVSQVPEATDDLSIRRLLELERGLLDHQDDEVRGIAEAAYRCASVASDIDAMMAEADNPFL